VQAALVLVVLGVAFFTRILTRAFARVDAPAVAAAGFPLAQERATRVAGAPTDRLIALAPFSALRTASASSAASSANRVPDVASMLRLIGTVADGDQSFAVCRLGAARARMLHLGDTLGGWKLLQVAPGRAIFVDAARVRRELRLDPTGN